MSSIVNKVKDAVHHDKSRDHETQEGNYRKPAAGTTTTGAGGGAYRQEAREGEYGPHSTRTANAADPRIDSDRDASNTLGGGRTGPRRAGEGGGAGAGGAGFGYDEPQSLSGTGYPGNSGNTGFTDTQRVGDGGVTHTTHTTQTTQHGAPRHRVNNPDGSYVDADRGGRATGGGAGGGLGAAAPNTMGPHGSDMMNKADPRVDSDRDGSTTMGRDRTYQQQRDPSDASQVPPSVLRRHLGDPSIEHDDHQHDRAGRHSSMTDQEAFRGI